MDSSNNDSFDYDYDYNNTCNNDLDTVALPALLYFVCILGVLGNAVILLMILCHTKIKTMTDVCLLNLAVSDFITAALLPLWARSAPSLIDCRVITGVYQLGLYSGSFFVTLMSIDRYLAIVHAVAAMKARSLHYGITINLIVWIVSVSMATPHVIFAHVDANEPNTSVKCGPLYPDGDELFWKKFRNFSENFVTLFLCLPIIIFCYVKILVVLSKARNSKKGKAVKLILVIVFLHAAFWVPYNLVVFLQTLQIYAVLDDCVTFKGISAALMATEIIALFHCCVNPVIYAFAGEKFRKSLSTIFLRYLHKREQRRGISGQKDMSEKETTNTPLRSQY